MKAHVHNSATEVHKVHRDGCNCGPSKPRGRTLVERAAIGVIDSYQDHVSQGLADEREYCCAYFPSCSHFTQDAIAEHGLLKGGAIGFMRLMRCHRGAEGGLDPVAPPVGYRPAHLDYQYENAEAIYSHPSRKPGKSEQTQATKTNWLGRVLAVPAGLAGAVAFGLVGGALGAALGGVAGSGKTDAFNSWIAREYSPESIYGIAKFENRLGRPGHRIHEGLARAAGTSVATALGGLIGSPVGAVLGFEEGLRTGWSWGSQFGRLAGKSLTSKPADTVRAAPAPSVSPGFSTLFSGRDAFQIGGSSLVPYYGEDMAEATLELLRSAQERIDIEMFSFKAPEVISLLKQKLADGVKVRILNDPVGRDDEERKVHQAAVQELEDAGAPVRHFPTFTLLHQLNHTKVAVVDGDTAYIGSKNWGLGFLEDWRESALFVSGGSAGDLSRKFESDWRTSGGKPEPSCSPSGNPRVRVLASQPREREAGPEILNKIRNSTSIDVAMYWLSSKEAVKALGNRSGGAIR